MPSTARTITVGGIGGFAAFVAGYLVTYLYRGRQVREALGGINALAEFLGANPVPPWKIVGWLYFNAHLVDVRVQVGPIGPRFVNMIQASESEPILLYAIPPVVLLVAGILLVYRSEPTDLRDGMGLVASIAAGYLVAAGGSVFLFGVGESGPDVVPAILLAGVIYPVVFAGLGAGLVFLSRRSSLRE